VTRRSAPNLALALALAAGAAVLARAVPPAPPDFRLGGDAERGKAVYARTCALCHGKAGDGKGTVHGEGPPATDFTDGERMAKRSDWEVYLAIRDGGAALGLSPRMIAWGKVLNDQQVRDAAAYVRTLARK
jgi:cytochrome c oxidase cbb3-type subunit 3